MMSIKPDLERLKTYILCDQKVLPLGLLHKAIVYICAQVYMCKNILNSISYKINLKIQIYISIVEEIVY